MSSVEKDFRYFDPVAYFKKHPEVEDGFLHLNYRPGDNEILAELFTDEEQPGVSLLKEYYTLGGDAGYGAYYAERLNEYNREAFGLRTDFEATSESESFSFFLNTLDKVILELKANHKEEDSPYRHMPQGYGDTMADWKAEAVRWEEASKKLEEMESLKTCPYTLHLILEDKTDVFIHEHEHFFTDIKFPELVKALEPKVYIGRYFDHGRPLEVDEEEVHLMRQATKGTFRNKRIAIKRSVRIKNGEIIGIDEIYKDDFTSEGPKTKDPFLQDVFMKRRGEANIESIITTIGSKQMDIVAHPYNEHLFVQGVAGSGKTMILLQRIHDLLATHAKLKSSVVFIEPNLSFEAYFDDFFNDRGMNDVRRGIMSKYLMDLVNRYYLQFTHHSYTDNNGTPSFAQEKTIRDRRYDYYWAKKCVIDKEGSIELRRVVYSRVLLPKYIRETLQSHTTAKLPVTNPLLTDFTNARKNGFKGDYDDWTMYIRGEEPTRSKTNPYIDFMDFERLIGEFLRKLRKESRGKDVPQSFDGLMDKGKISTALAFALLRLCYEAYGPLEERYRDSLIAIDECQDYNLGIYWLLSKVEPTAVFNIFGDSAQDIGYHGGFWDKDKTIAEQIGYQMGLQFHCYQLLENYRNSNQIVQFCKENFKFDNHGYGISTMPVYRIDTKRLISLLSFHQTLKDRSVIIYDRKYEKNIHEVIKPLLLKYGFDGVALLDPIEAKGMEFDNVFVVGFTEMNFNERYVSCTRALNELYIVQTKVAEE